MDKTNICLVIGDSLPMPSSELKYTDTWIYKLGSLKDKLHIVNRCARSSSSKRLEGEGPEGKDILEFYSPQIVITHLGIPDAAPRLLKRNSLLTRVINHLPFSKLIYDFIRKTRGRTIENCDLNPKQFFQNFDRYAKRCAANNLKLIIIEISEGTTVLQLSPLFNKSVAIYNAKLQQVADNNDNVILIPAIKSHQKDCYQSDGIHLNPKGQKIILNRIIDILSDNHII